MQENTAPHSATRRRVTVLGVFAGAATAAALAMAAAPAAYATGGSTDPVVPFNPFTSSFAPDITPIGPQASTAVSGTVPFGQQDFSYSQLGNYEIPQYTDTSGAFTPNEVTGDTILWANTHGLNFTSLQAFDPATDTTWDQWTSGNMVNDFFASPLELNGTHIGTSEAIIDEFLFTSGSGSNESAFGFDYNSALGTLSAVDVADGKTSTLFSIPIVFGDDANLAADAPTSTAAALPDLF